MAGCVVSPFLQNVVVVPFFVVAVGGAVWLEFVVFMGLALSDGYRSGKMLDAFTKLMEELVGSVSAAVLAMCEEMPRNNTTEAGKTFAVAGFILDAVLIDHLGDGSIARLCASWSGWSSRYVIPSTQNPGSLTVIPYLTFEVSAVRL